MDRNEATQVLMEVRAKFGRGYKNAIRRAWMSATYNREGLTEWANRLQQVRNEYGPAWLARFVPPKPEIPSLTPASVHQTPGPWTVVLPIGSCGTVEAQGIDPKYRRTVCAVYETATLSNEADHLTADCKLIAAAPDLLKAARFAAKALSSLRKDCQDGYTDEARRLLRDATEKASDEKGW